MMQERIPLSDGEYLSVSVFIPDRLPAPCILEALPYRKDDMTSGWRPEYQRFCEEFGFAVARIDVRGTGSSGGRATDEYPKAEQRDLAEGIEWLAAQPWCTGRIGMFGTSYGGFNSFQLACERPAHLGAIIPIYATDDRYTDDVHYMGGALKWLDQIDYCAYMTPMNALPPVPQLWGESWREEWLRRVDEHEPWQLTWMSHPIDDAYWRHGSVRPDYGRIAVPTMIIAGWADGFRNTTFRAIEQLTAPSRLLVGPWSHAAPTSSAPGPRIDHVEQMAAFFDEHLRDGPGTWQLPHTWYCRYSHAPHPMLDTVPGQWRADTWPSPRSSTLTLLLADQPQYAVRADVGTAAWLSCAGHLPYGQPADQRHDDAASITWDFPITEAIEIAGHVLLSAEVIATCPNPILAVRLCDVAPDGTSTLVTRGTLRIASHGRVDLELEATAWRWLPGRTLRVCVAGADWPNVVAPGGPGWLTLRDAVLTLPVYLPDPDAPVPQFAPGNDTSSEDPEGITWLIERDVVREVTRCVVGSRSDYQTPHGSGHERYDGWVSVHAQTFAQHAHSDVEFTLRFGQVQVTTRSVMDLSTAAGEYLLRIGLTVSEGDAIIRERTWEQTFPRA